MRVPKEAVEKLRKWRRHQLRAAELQVVLPDSSILIKALTGLVQEVLNGAPQAAFRVNSFRLQSQVDTKPSAHNLESYFQMLLAEMETLVLSPETGEAGSAPQNRILLTSRVYNKRQTVVAKERNLLCCVEVGARKVDAGLERPASMITPSWWIRRIGAGCVPVLNTGSRNAR